MWAGRWQFYSGDALIKSFLFSCLIKHAGYYPAGMMHVCVLLHLLCVESILRQVYTQVPAAAT